MSGKNRFELHESRLATTDEHGRRVYIHPEDIHGKWKTRRTYFYWFLIGIYLVLPWVYVNGKQWVLLDLPKREFHIFGNIFYGHDGPLLIFVLLGFLFLMAFITSVWGRVWCGWACPQTVFIHAIYQRIERLVEGKARERKALDEAPWGAQKIFKRGLKWALYILVSLHITHSFLGYFVGTHRLFWITMSPPTEHMTLFITMLVITGIILFDFGWFKEQFCIIACPYGRFQSVFMDVNSSVVAYDKKRGEPHRAPDVPKEDEGDCINCYRCVKACPTGIDIRRGTQLECIACTMCIDACDEIMTKLKKPTGLIRYTTESELEGGKKKVGVRTGIYATLMTAVIIGLFTTLSIRKDLRVQFIRGSKTPFNLIQKETGEREVVNHYKVKFNYYGSEKYHLYFKPVNPEVAAKLNIVMPQAPLEIKNANKQADAFFRFPVELLQNGSRIIKVNLYSSEDPDESPGNLIKEVEVKLVGPFK
jgi:cytochrome c oxidase accessory protein FixG